MKGPRESESSPQAKLPIELTQAEWEIMRVVWEKQPCTAGTVQEKLAERHRRVQAATRLNSILAKTGNPRYDRRLVWMRESFLASHCSSVNISIVVLVLCRTPRPLTSPSQNRGDAPQIPYQVGKAREIQ